MTGECKDLERCEANSRETKDDRDTHKARFFMFDHQAFLKPVMEILEPAANQ